MRRFDRVAHAQRPPSGRAAVDRKHSAARRAATRFGQGHGLEATAVTDVTLSAMHRCDAGEGCGHVTSRAAGRAQERPCHAATERAILQRRLELSRLRLTHALVHARLV